MASASLTQVVRRNNHPVFELGRNDRRPCHNGLLRVLHGMLRLQVRVVVCTIDIISGLEQLDRYSLRHCFLLTRPQASGK